MHFDLTEEQSAIQDMARKFTADEITPFAAAWDEHHTFPRATLNKAAELGFGAIYVGEEFGGIGLSRIDAALIIEALAYGCPSTSAFISIHNMATWMIDTFGSDEVRAKYVPKLATMEHIASYCLTEPGAGSDAASLKTRADKDGDAYILNGGKAFISGGGVNEVYVVMARTDQNASAGGISCFVVDKNTPGLSFGGQEKKMGWHSQPTASVLFDDCRIPASNLIGAPGDGFKIAMKGLDGGRLNIGACSLGGAQRCLDDTISYVKERRQFGQRIADFQNTQFMLADMKTQLEAARALMYIAADKVSREAADKNQWAAMAKLMSTETGSKVANDALQLHGGYGYLMDFPIERFVRDLRVHEILEGTNQIMRFVIGRELVGQ
ncbi:MAG: acyl-CoA dehydrogenase [Gammaproteobacteria bacterium]|nr:acyl-CoA dehydrogenase [Gammaproteobacteria bacterium]MCH1551792.1 acyl-CoA dehydrogenase family protein [Pseudomonadales bacterium]